MSIRIGVVDDHCLVCNGIRNFFEGNRNFTVVFHAYNAKECLEQLSNRENRIDILLLDIAMPDTNGFEVFDIIRKKYFHIRIIFLTSFNDYSNFSYALNIGADGYILKNIDFPELELAVYHVNCGLQYIDKRLMDYYIKYCSCLNHKSNPLTKREKQILDCVVSGMINKEIAAILHIKEETVKNHLENIYKKMSVNDRTQAAVQAVRNHYINL